jgi:glycosyltransferase involved in cell wall biosynthesis
MNLLLFNLRLDASHTALGFTTVWTRALARRFKHVTVVTMEAGEIDVEPNVTVHSLGREHGRSEPRRLFAFYRIVGRALRERPVHAAFVHQAPLFAVMFAPIAKPRGIPVLLWYAHGAVSRTLRAAHLVADRCVSASASSFRIPSEKLEILGHGIDTDAFRPPDEIGEGHEQTLVSVGRLSAVKRLDELLEAIAILSRDHGREVRLQIVGGPLTEADERTAAALRERAHGLGIKGSVSFEGPVPFTDIAPWYRRGGIFVSLSETGSLDKAILEAIASGCLPVVRNDAFAELAARHGVEELVPGAGAAAVAVTLEHALALAPERRAELRRELREAVREEHGLESLIDAITGRLEELATAAGRA